MIKKIPSLYSVMPALSLVMLTGLGVTAHAQYPTAPFESPAPPKIAVKSLNSVPPAVTAVRKTTSKAKDEARVPSKVQALMQTMTANNGINARAFLTPSGLWGIAIEKEGGAQVVFTDANASTVTIGVMLTLPDKRNVGSDFLAQKMPSATDLLGVMQKQAQADSPTVSATDNRAATAEEVQAAEASNGFSSASTKAQGRKQIYAFIDPLCGFCANAWNALAQQPALAASHQIKWIPMALGDDLSLAAVMLSDSASERFAVTAKIYQSTAAGKQPVGRVATPAELAAAQTNAELVKRINIHSTPTFLVQGDDGGFVRKEGFESVTALVRKVK